MTVSQGCRINDLCWYLTAAFKRPAGKWRRGVLHNWGQDFENDDNMTPFPVGVIEDCETGQVRAIHVDRITFAENAPE